MALPKIDVPTYEIELPLSKKKIKYRPFLVKEQKLFLMNTENDDVESTVKVIRQVLKNCVLNDIDIDSFKELQWAEHIIHDLQKKGREPWSGQ